MCSFGFVVKLVPSPPLLGVLAGHLLALIAVHARIVIFFFSGEREVSVTKTRIVLLER